MQGQVATSLFAMTAGQVGVAMAVMAVPVLAPQIAVGVGIDPGLVGLHSAIAFVGAVILTALAGSVTARFGAIRTTQIAMLLAATGLALPLTGWSASLVAGALAVGMGYGIATPAASHLLARTVSRRHRGIAFSAKQTGVPLGGFILGLTVPIIASLLGWPWGLAMVIAVVLLVALAVQPLRSRFDADRDPDRKIRPAETLLAVRMVLRDPQLRPLALSAFAYAMMQLSIFTYYVVVLVERGGLTPVAAGAVFSLMHAGGVVGRPLLGWISDRLLPARPLLSIVGFSIFLCAIALAALDDSWPPALLWFVSLTAGIVAAGWNGVYLAEIARVMPVESVSRATGGVSVFAFLGVALGPAVFSGVLLFTASYSAAFMTVGSVALLPACLLLRAPRRAI